jgi:hypothetical protein
MWSPRMGPVGRPMACRTAPLSLGWANAISPSQSYVPVPVKSRSVLPPQGPATRPAKMKTAAVVPTVSTELSLSLIGPGHRFAARCWHDPAPTTTPTTRRRPRAISCRCSPSAARARKTASGIDGVGFLLTCPGRPRPLPALWRTHALGQVRYWRGRFALAHRARARAPGPSARAPCAARSARAALRRLTAAVPPKMGSETRSPRSAAALSRRGRSAFTGLPWRPPARASCMSHSHPLQMDVRFLGARQRARVA